MYTLMGICMYIFIFKFMYFLFDSFNWYIRLKGGQENEGKNENQDRLYKGANFQ